MNTILPGCTDNRTLYIYTNRIFKTRKVERKTEEKRYKRKEKGERDKMGGGKSGMSTGKRRKGSRDEKDGKGET